jgi:hypothetical protein
VDSVDIYRLTAEELWARLIQLAKLEKGATYDLVETLAETDRRGLYKDHSYVSLFECCVVKLGLSEAAAYRRIRAARALKLFPPIGPLLRQGKLSLEAIALLHPFLKDADAATLVSAAVGKRVWEVERLIAGRRTEEPRRDVVRLVASSLTAPLTPSLSESPLFKIPDGVPVPQAPAVSIDSAKGAEFKRVTVASPEISRHAVRIGFTADESFFKLLCQAQAVMRHKYPDGRLDGVFRDALQALLRKKTPWAFRKAKP